MYVFPEQDVMKNCKPKKPRKCYQSDHTSQNFKMAFQIWPWHNCKKWLFFPCKHTYKIQGSWQAKCLLSQESCLLIWRAWRLFTVLLTCLVRLHASVYKPALNYLGLEIKVWHEEDLCEWPVLGKYALWKIWEIIHLQCQSYISSLVHKGTLQGKI